MKYFQIIPFLVEYPCKVHDICLYHTSKRFHNKIGSTCCFHITKFIPPSAMRTAMKWIRPNWPTSRNSFINIGNLDIVRNVDLQYWCHSIFNCHEILYYTLNRNWDFSITQLLFNKHFITLIKVGSCYFLFFFWRCFSSGYLVKIILIYF